MRSTSSITERLKKLERNRIRFSKIADGHGMPIDSGIFDLIVLLNTIGLKTAMSCFGHTSQLRDHAPWITFSINGYKELVQKYYTQKDKEFEIRDKMDKELALKKRVKIHQRSLSVRAKMCTSLRTEYGDSLMRLLDEFYTTRKVSQDTRLILKPLPPYSTLVLESQGAGFQIGRSHEDMLNHLSHYQEEMTAFAQFLNETFFDKRLSL